MITKVIVVEIRQAKKNEKGLYGQTLSEDGISKVFINSRQSQGEMLNTFFHELAHAYIHWQDDSSLSDDEEERIARMVGNVAEPCFRRYKSGKTREYKRTG